MKPSRALYLQKSNGKISVIFDLILFLYTKATRITETFNLVNIHLQNHVMLDITCQYREDGLAVYIGFNYKRHHLYCSISADLP